MIDQQALLERFLRYVQIESMAVAGARRYPISDGQLTMGRLLADELQQMGIEAKEDA